MDLPFPTEDLARLYRFALLTTGDEAAAQQIVYDACLGCAARLGSYRNNESAFACLLENIRVRAKTAVAGEAGGGETPQVARIFSTMPEPERAALAMLYSGLLPARSVAQVLKMRLEEMGEVLKRARGHLQKGAQAGPRTDEPTSMEAAL